MNYPRITFPPMQRESTALGRLYTLPDGVTKVPSVTTVINVISKGYALENWIAAEERKLVLETAKTSFEGLSGADGAGQFMGGAEFRDLVEANLGKTKAHRRKLQEAADLGSAAHHEVERRIKEMMGQSVPGPQPMPEGAELVVMAFDDFRKQHDLRPLATEGCLFDKFAGYAGCFDILAIVDGALTLIDLKSSKRIWRTQFLQLAAYQACVSRHPALKGQGIQSMILRLPKSLDDIRIETAIIKPEEHAPHLRAFLAARALWGWLNKFEYEPPSAMRTTPEAVHKPAPQPRMPLRPRRYIPVPAGRAGESPTR